MAMLRTVYKIANGQTTTELMSPEYDGAVVLLFFYNGAGAQVTPTGTPTVSRQVGTRYVPVAQYGQDEWRFNGPADRVQINLSGVAGYTSYEGFVWRASHALDVTPAGVFTGLRAMTTQNFIEANTRLGMQFEISAMNAALAAGANQDFVIVTGAKPIIINAREVQFTGAKMELHGYINPVYTGGVNIPYYNLNLRNPATGLAQFKAGVTVTSPGTEIMAPTYGVGSAAVGPSVVGSVRAAGSQRLLAANSTYLFRTTNTDSSAQVIVTYATWFEGDTDLPV
jgi:hypothetical protein